MHLRISTNFSLPWYTWLRNCFLFVVFFRLLLMVPVCQESQVSVKRLSQCEYMAQIFHYEKYTSMGYAICIIPLAVIHWGPRALRSYCSLYHKADQGACGESWILLYDGSQKVRHLCLRKSRHVIPTTLIFRRLRKILLYPSWGFSDGRQG